jgi:hypothetical protein
MAANEAKVPTGFQSMVFAPATAFCETMDAKLDSTDAVTT